MKSVFQVVFIFLEIFLCFVLIYFECAVMRKVCLTVCELWLLQGGGEAKTLTPKQCIIIDAGLETIKVGGHLHRHMSGKKRCFRCPYFMIFTCDLSTAKA